jgi:hypothetical protein
MQGEDYLNGLMYHMTHSDNLFDIIKSRNLLSQQKLEETTLQALSIANEEVQNLRKRIFVWSIPEKRYRALHSYVPFYFATQTPMFYNQRNKGIQNNLVIFEVSCAYIGSVDHSVLFTDGNASKQQLSKFRGEKVYIEPATLDKDCKRRYIPNGPHGKSVKVSDFYADPSLLTHVNWDVITGHTFIEDKEEYLRLKHAEVLCPDNFPLDEMLSICVGTRKMVETVKSIFVACGYTEKDFDLPIAYKPHLFN